MRNPDGGRRVAVVAGDAERRARLRSQLAALSGVDVVAWAEDVDALVLLGTRLDLCLCAEPPSPDDAERLGERGIALVVLRDGAAVDDALLRAAPPPGPDRPRRPRLAPRQKQVMVAYVAGNDLLPTVARNLGMERETLKTHLRRIRGKYQEVGRPAPTRRDLYVRAVEDGLIPPPAGGNRRLSDDAAPS